MTEEQAEEVLNVLSEINRRSAVTIDKLTEISAKLATVANSDPRSSVEVEQNSRGVSRSVKVYAGSPVHDVVNEAAIEYHRLGGLVLPQPEPEYEEVPA